jgi:hypothetical protein
MAHLWTIGQAGDWGVFRLDAEAFELGAGAQPVRIDELSDADAAGAAAVLLRRIDDASGPRWALLARPEAHALVNGAPAHLGVVMLSDRDEIRAGSASPLFFSTEAPATVSSFPESGPRGFCPRCKQALQAGAPAVRCPDCGLWHHESEDLNCWTYAPQCAGCPHDTALDGGFRWTPEDL